jgi:hypothetical protein
MILLCSRGEVHALHHLGLLSLLLFTAVANTRFDCLFAHTPRWKSLAVQTATVNIHEAL